MTSRHFDRWNLVLTNVWQTTQRESIVTFIYRYFLGLNFDVSAPTTVVTELLN